ncbi:MAG: PAS domain-containing protein, partial [Campylobacterota bacterium]|nr:PAS domain-containing protein [Campylobacterota bacterium]
MTPNEKTLQNDLYFEQERLKLAIKSVKIGLWDWDLVENTIYFSPEFKEMLGYSDDEIENDFSQWEKRVHPDDIKKTYLDIEENHKKITSEYQNIHRLRHKNGSWVWILDKGKTYFNEKDEPIRMIGFHINVTDDIMLETKYRNLFNQIKEGVLVYKVEDNGNKFILKDCNESAQDIDNIDIKDIIGKEILEIFPEIKDIGFLDILKEVYKNGETKVIPSFEYTHNNLEKSWRKYYIYKLINNDIVLIYEDLTKEYVQLKTLNSLLKKEEF